MIRRALTLTAAVLLVAVPPIFGAGLRLDGGSLAVFSLAPSLPIVTASVEIGPTTLARHDTGWRVTVLIEAPDGALDLRTVVPGSLRMCLDGPLCDTGAAALMTRVGDADRDGIRDLKVTFARADVLALVAAVPAPADITFVVSAVLRGGMALTGTDTVRVIDDGPRTDGDGSGKDAAGEAAASSPDLSSAEPEPSIAPTSEPSGEPSIAPMPTPAPTPDPHGEPAPSPSPGEGAPAG